MRDRCASATCALFHHKATRIVWCGWCGNFVSLGPSNDRIPRREKAFAMWLGDLHRLWEPGAERNAFLDIGVDSFSRLP